MIVRPEEERDGSAAQAVNQAAFDTPAAGLGIRCEYDAPEEAFMIVQLRQGALQGATGIARYHAAFSGL